jgi:purine-binding chemotaxis protein CheW
MSELNRYIVFTLDEARYGLPLFAVQRVIPAVEITPLPEAHNFVLGLINLQGRIIPTLNLRKKFQMPEREIEPASHFIIASISDWTVALPVDTVLGLFEPTIKEVIPSKNILPDLKNVESVLRVDDNIILIHSPEKYLSLDEGMVLRDIIKQL